MSKQEDVNKFWMKRHLALFDLSRDPQKISRQVYDLLVRKGYNITPLIPMQKISILFSVINRWMKFSKIWMEL